MTDQDTHPEFVTTEIIETTGKSSARQGEFTAVLSMSAVDVIATDETAAQLLTSLVNVYGTRVARYDGAHDYLRRRRDGHGCLVLDLAMGGINALGWLRHTVNVLPATVCISAQGGVAEAVCAMKAGAWEFLTRPVDPATMLLAVRGAIYHDCLRWNRRVWLASLRQRFENLSNRERQVFSLLLAGLRNKQAAWELGISELTLQAHRGHIMKKMLARSFAELVRMGTDLGVGTTVDRGLDEAVYFDSHGWMYPQAAL